MYKFILLCLFALPVYGAAWSPTISWEEVTTREDGSPLPRSEIESYVITVVFPDDSVKTYIRPNNLFSFKPKLLVMGGNYAFTMMCCDTKNVCSESTDPIVKQAPEIDLPPPTNTRID